MLQRKRPARFVIDAGRLSLSRMLFPLSSQPDNVLCRLASIRLNQIELDLFSLLQRSKSAALNTRVVNETFLSAFYGSNESVALCVVEPLHSAGCTHGEGSFHFREVCNSNIETWPLRYNAEKPEVPIVQFPTHRLEKRIAK